MHVLYIIYIYIYIYIFVCIIYIIYYIYILYIYIISIYIIRIYIISIRTYFYLFLLKFVYYSRFCCFTVPIAMPNNDNTLI